jgi:hypothetical protein
MVEYKENNSLWGPFLCIYLVEWAIATHGMYESSQVCLV